MQEGLLTVKLESFPDPELPPIRDTEPGWIVHEPRAKNKLLDADYDFKDLISAVSDANDESAAKKLMAAAWYEYARESARVRSTAATYSKWYGIASGCGRRERYARQEKFPSRAQSLDWVATCAWMRIEWLRNRLDKWAEDLNQRSNQERARQVLEKWGPRLKRLSEGERAWSKAQEWLSRIQGKCSLGAPCLLTLSQWIGEDCPWIEIKYSRNPALDVAALAIERGPTADDPFWGGGNGKHPIAGLTGGLQLNAGFSTVSPRSAFLRRTGNDGEYLSDDEHWTEDFEYKEFRRERFVGQIIWNRPDNEIVEDFLKWLKWRRSLLPEKFQGMAKRVSRTKWDDPAAALKDLAALRLRAHFGATGGSRKWAEIYSPGRLEQRFNSGAIERQARRAAADAIARFNEWMEGWPMDSAMA